MACAGWGGGGGEEEREEGRQHAAGSKQVDVNTNTVSNGEVMQSKPATN